MENTETVADLINTLQTLPQDAIIVMSKDSEGNNYSPLSGYCEGIYLPLTTYSGEFFDEENIAEMAAEDDQTVEEWLEDQAETYSAVVLWPIN